MYTLLIGPLPMFHNLLHIIISNIYYVLKGGIARLPWPLPPTPSPSPGALLPSQQLSFFAYPLFSQF